MDPRPHTTDPLAAVDADIDALDSVPEPEQPAIYGRIHAGLAAALAGTQPDKGPAPVDARTGDRPGR
ncbi:hypothetical protein [Nakamurella lactea]|uniref:hypothetical protein n=1 Tax=Nakamurella lactea TaxID=459515 RepID=UPI0004271C0A|nr:hypothetical protein [Nakamurella lactea]